MKTTVRGSGFTLIELMVAVAIIAVLITIAVGSFIYAQKVSRDGKRISDLRSIESALELYYAKYKKYPVRGTLFVSSAGSPQDYIGNLTFGEESQQLVPEFMRAFPKDPLNDISYSYWYYGYGGYKIAARMELSNKLAKNSMDGGVCDGWLEIFSPSSPFPASKPPPAQDAANCAGP